ncbi:bifunctional DNA primase/polymerase [Singulisphaera sp. PoT]|uniref:bifunctional DNA primase/polymerase n=1 Tax=Singulisphaera sp. PoT TaxID=3411797 RepID=UPI003BF5FFEF
MREKKAVADTAMAAIAAGISVVPPSEDGTKRPQGAWKRFQRELASPAQIQAWYPGSYGVGFVTGAVSGGLELLEFDDRATYESYLERATEAGLGELVERIEGGYLESSPSGGIHWLYRTAELRPNTKLAERIGPDDAKGRPTREVLIETRGEGGYVVVAPSFGPVHPSEDPYRMIRGGVESIIELDAAERDALWDLARSFDEVKPQVHREPKSKPLGLRPGESWAAQTDWREILEPHGWTRVFSKGEETFWRRPGKDLGVSATTNFGGSDLFFPFTSSSEFEPQASYSKFATFATLEHGGNYQAAAKALATLGFGEARVARDGHECNGSRGGMTAQVIDEADDPPVVAREWPSPPRAAYAGLLGEIVGMIEPHTEADPVAILGQLLVGLGNLMGRNSYFQVESTRHYLNLFLGLVGESSKARKGTSWDQARSLLAAQDPAWDDDRIQFGLSSGEGLIWAVRDAIYKREAKKKDGKVVGHEEVEIDPGIDDKRLLVLETELGSTLKVLTREGNTLSGQLRQAWDNGRLRTLVKTNPAKATDAHISIIGHVTRAELVKNLTETEAANGFANRFLWLCVRRSKLLPFGGRISTVNFSGASRALAEVVDFGRIERRLERDREADDLWASVYPELSEGRPGLLGSVIGRAEAQTMRLAALFAVVDRSEVIRLRHLEAGLTLWKYAEHSARFIFGDSLGDPDADRLMAALREAPQGLTRTQIREDVFQKNKPSAEIARILGRLLEQGSVRSERIDTGGRRPAELWLAVSPITSNHPLRLGSDADAVNAIDAVSPAMTEENRVNGVTHPSYSLEDSEGEGRWTA